MTASNKVVIDTSVLHDALIALNCRLFKIGAIASFDHDFDQVEWLTRLETPGGVAAAFMAGGSPKID